MLWRVAVFRQVVRSIVFNRGAAIEQRRQGKPIATDIHRGHGRPTCA